MTSPIVDDGQPRDDRSLGQLFAGLTTDLSTLMRQEVDLAKAEIRQSATHAGAGVGMLVGAGVAGFLVLLFLSTALWVALGTLIGDGWSAVVVAAVWAVITAVLAAVGKGRLKRVDGVPQTTETVKQIPNALKGNEEENR